VEHLGQDLLRRRRHALPEAVHLVAVEAPEAAVEDAEEPLLRDQGGAQVGRDELVAAEALVEALLVGDDEPGVVDAELLLLLLEHFKCGRFLNYNGTVIKTDLVVKFQT